MSRPRLRRARVGAEVGVSRVAARGALSARRASRFSHRGAGRPPRGAERSESVPRIGGRGAGSGQRGAGSGQGGPRNAWRRSPFASGVRGNRGRLDGASQSGSPSEERGRGLERERPHEQVGERDARQGRLPALGRRRCEKRERLESKEGRTSSLRKRPRNSVAARGVRTAARATYGGRLHESAKRPCARGRRLRPRVGRRWR